MSRPATQSERLSILETEARMRAASGDKAMSEVAKELHKLNTRLEKIEAEQRSTNERLTAYENKGKGVLFGAMLAGGGLMTAAVALWEKIRGIFA